MAPEDRWVRVGDLRARYWSEGDGDPPLLLLHPHGAFLEHWLPNFAALAERRRVIAVDMVGCGRTDKPDAVYSFGYMADFVESFLRAIALDRVDLLGHSLGGGIALALALRAPERVRRLVLVCAAGLGRRIPRVLGFMNVPILGEIMAKPTRFGLRRFFGLCMYDASIITDAQIALAVAIHSQPGAARAALSVLRESTSVIGGVKQSVVDELAGRLGELRQPTLVLWGRDDRIHRLAYGEAAAKTIAGARLHLFDRCGHLPNVEHPREFNAVVDEFLIRA
jgi:pimeloyl-ACP methyl ester carboxylesterase